jgi:hypothetical protein
MTGFVGALHHTTGDVVQISDFELMPDPVLKSMPTRGAQDYGTFRGE